MLTGKSGQIKQKQNFGKIQECIAMNVSLAIIGNWRMWSNTQIQVQNFQEKLKSLPKIKPLE